MKYTPTTKPCVLGKETHMCVLESETQTRQLSRTHLQHKCVYFRMVSLDKKIQITNILRYTLVESKLKLFDTCSRRVQQNDMKFWKERDWEALQEKKAWGKTEMVLYIFYACTRMDDKKFWKERDWEVLQKKRRMKMDEAVRLLNMRTEDEVELDQLVNQVCCSELQ